MLIQKAIFILQLEFMTNHKTPYKDYIYIYHVKVTQSQRKRLTSLLGICRTLAAGEPINCIVHETSVKGFSVLQALSLR